MLDWEFKPKNRIIFENEGAVAVTPFFSREPFEIRIFPKRHLPYFEDTSDADMAFVVEALHFSLKKLAKNLNDPDYNFFIHTAPVKNKVSHQHYHWHIEIVPKTTIRAGFELGTGVEINIIDPDDAAKILKK
jgi:UDPglucose--hexose-1-phosphate uridylyltransferase